MVLGCIQADQLFTAPGDVQHGGGGGIWGSGMTAMFLAAASRARVFC
jgi:hypothetical protein